MITTICRSSRASLFHQPPSGRSPKRKNAERRKSQCNCRRNWVVAVALNHPALATGKLTAGLSISEEIIPVNPNGLTVYFPTHEVSIHSTSHGRFHRSLGGSAFARFGIRQKNRYCGPCGRRGHQGRRWRYDSGRGKTLAATDHGGLCAAARHRCSRAEICLFSHPRRWTAGTRRAYQSDSWTRSNPVDAYFRR